MLQMNPKREYYPLGGSMPALPARLSSQHLYPLLAVLLARPFLDAAYMFEVAKFIYMGLMIAASVVAVLGERLTRSRVSLKPHKPERLRYYFAVAGYSIYVVAISVLYGDPLAEASKILSPFILAILLEIVDADEIAPAIAWSAALMLAMNACLLPFSYGWVSWGGINTFRGIFYFKTDLAYAATFSVLMVAVACRYRLGPLMIGVVVLGGILVIKSNSRLNYLAYGLTIVFIATRGGFSWKSVKRLLMVLGPAVVLFLLIFDPNKMLGFDTSDPEAFSQGRNNIWDMIFESLKRAGIATWLFGAGPFGDVRISEASYKIGAEGYNAHNEFLHLLITQGIVGLTAYFYTWYSMIRSVTASTGKKMGAVYFGMFLFLLQGFTTVVSSFASKTWPLMLLIFYVAYTSDEPEAAPSQEGPAAKRFSRVNG